MTLIHLLTPEQTALIAGYQQKWRRLYLSTQSVEEIRATSAIKGAYAAMNRPEPKVIFCASPRAALKVLMTYAKTSKVNSASQPDELLQALSKTFFEVASTVLDVHKERPAAGAKPLHNLLSDVTQALSKESAKYIDKQVSQPISTQDILEQTTFDVGVLVRIYGHIHRHIYGPLDSEWFRDIRSLPSEAKEDAASMIALGMSESFPEPIESQLGRIPRKNLFLRNQMKNWCRTMLKAQVVGYDYPPFRSVVCSELSTQENAFLQKHPPIVTSELARECMFIDFATSVLNFTVPVQKWSALQELAKHCGWILAVDNLCVVCDRPTQVLVDEEYQFYQEDIRPTLQYSDGLLVYADE